MRMIRVAGAGLLALLAACTDATAPPAADHADSGGVEGWTTRAPSRIGWVRGPTGTPVQVSYQVRGRYAVTEGDIIVGRATAIADSRADSPLSSGAAFGLVTTDLSLRWPGGRVPYQIHSLLPAKYRVTDAIAHIEAHNPTVDFVPRTNETDYILIVPSTGCASYIGRVGGVQELLLAESCTTGNTIHELLHALGSQHEHMRCDRDNYIEVLWQNIRPEWHDQFTRLCGGFTTVSWVY